MNWLNSFYLGFPFNVLPKIAAPSKSNEHVIDDYNYSCSCYENTLYIVYSYCSKFIAIANSILSCCWIVESECLYNSQKSFSGHCTFKSPLPALSIAKNTSQNQQCQRCF